MNALPLKSNILLATITTLTTTFAASTWLSAPAPWHWAVWTYLMIQTHQLICLHILRCSPKAIIAIHPMSTTHVWVEKSSGMMVKAMPEMHRILRVGWLITFHDKESTIVFPKKQWQPLCHQWCRWCKNAPLKPKESKWSARSLLIDSSSTRNNI